MREQADMDTEALEYASFVYQIPLDETSEPHLRKSLGFASKRLSLASHELWVDLAKSFGKVASVLDRAISKITG